MPCRAFTLAAALIALAHGTAPASGETASSFYVSPAGLDRWSGRLPSPDVLHDDGPFATLARAQAAMRGQSGQRRAIIRAGRYFLTSPLDLGPSDSGEEFAAYPAEAPIIYGGGAVQGGLVQGASIAKSPDAAAVGLAQIFVDGRLAELDRIPAAVAGDDHESSWFFAEASPAGTDMHRSFRARSRDAATFDAIGPDAWVTIFGRRGWQDSVLPVRHWDAATRMVTLDGRTWDDIGEGSRWALLRAAAIPARSHGPGHVVKATLPCIISAAHTSSISFSDLHLVGSATEGAAFCLSDTRNILLDGLALTDAGDGVRLDHAAGTRITRSEIGPMAGFGIVLRHGSDGTVVEDNWLHDIGWLHQDASAIWFDASSRNSFSHNRIERIAKFAIGGGSLTQGGAYDNRITGNEIDHANQRTSDGGAIMVIGWAQDDTHDVIDGNIITRTSALGNMGWDGMPHSTFQDPVTSLVSEAIYLDDWASGVTVSGNLLCGNLGGIELHAGWNNSVRDNLLAGNTGMAIAVDAEDWLGKGAHPHPMEHNLIDHNTILLEAPSTGQTGAVSVRGTDTSARFTGNTYAGPGLNAYSFHHEPHAPWASYSFGLDDWRTRGQDAMLPPPGGAPAFATAGRRGDREGVARRIRENCHLSSAELVDLPAR